MRLQVLEQSENKKELGFMILMGSNAMRVLTKMGIYLLPVLHMCDTLYDKYGLVVNSEVKGSIIVRHVPLL